MDQTNRVQAILSVQDQGFTTMMEKARISAEKMGQGIDGAGKQSSTFMQTLGGMAGAIGITSLVSKGFDMIGDSVGKAMARADTMDNFNRTMTLMTGSSEKAGQALDDLGVYTKGTAYGLDVAAKATQGLVSSGTDIGTATKQIGGWMDAVSTYGEGSNEQLQNVTFQLSQMSAKGKANLGDLKSAMEAGIPVIKIYAEATGQSTEQVNDAISKGKVSSAEFMKVMDEAFRSGTKSFKGIEGMAKKAGGTWKGSFDNMKAATTRGVLSIIQAIEDGRKDANLPGMKDAVADFGKFIEGSMKAVAPVVRLVAANFEDLIGIAGRGVAVWGAYKVVGEVSGHLQRFREAAAQSTTVLASMQGQSQSFLGVNKMLMNGLKDQATQEKTLQAARKLGIDILGRHKTVEAGALALTEAQKWAILGETGALSAKSLILGVIQGKIKLTTLAQLGFNAAMKANPIGMIIAGVTALAGVLTFLNKKLTEQSAAQRKANEEAEDMANRNEDLIKSSQKLAESYKENTAEAKTNANEAQRMVKGLKEIENSSKSAEEKQFLLAKGVKELNEKYPELNVQLDETGTALATTTEEIDAQVKAMQAAAEEKAMSDYLSELYTKQTEQTMALEETKKKMEEMESTGSNMQKTLFGLGQKQTEEYTKLKDTYANLKTELDQTGGRVESFQEKLKVKNETLFKAQQAAEAERNALDKLKEKFQTTSDSVSKFAQLNEKDQEKIRKDIAKTAETYGVSMDDIIQTMDRLQISFDELKGLYKVADDLGVSVDLIHDHMKNLDITLEEFQGIYKLAEEFDLGITQIKEAMDRGELSLEGFKEAHEKNLGLAEEALDTYVTASTDGWSKLEGKSEISIKKYIKNLKDNQKAMEEMQTNYEILVKRGVDPAILQEAMDKGPAQAAAIFQAWVKETGTATKNGQKEMSKGGEKLIKEMNEARSKGIQQGYDQAVEQVEMQDWKEVAGIPFDEMTKKIAEDSPLLKERYKEGAKESAHGAVLGTDEGLVGLADVAKMKADRAVGSLKRALSEGKAGAFTESRGIVGSIGKGIDPLEELLEGEAADGVNAFNKGVRNKQDSVFTTGRTMKNNYVKSVKDGLKEKTRSEAMTAVDGFVGGSNSKLPSVRTSGTNIKQEFKDKINSGLKTSLFGYGSDGVGGLIGGANSKKGSWASTGTKLKSTLLSQFSDIGDKMFPRGQNAVEGAKRGVNSKRESFFDRAASLARGFLRRFDKTVEIASPSKKMKQRGKFLVEGAIRGVDGNAQGFFKSAEGLGLGFATSFDESMQGKLQATTASVTEAARGLDTTTIRGANGLINSTRRNPAYINLEMAGRAFGTFVDDITRQQDNRAELDLVYR